MRNQLRNIVEQARESGPTANQPASTVLAAEAIRLARAAASIHLMCAVENRATLNINSIQSSNCNVDCESAAARAALILSETRR